MASIQTLLQPNVLSRLVSRKMAAEQWILGFFGFEPGGRNELNLGHGRQGNFDLFNNTRTVGEGRAPGASAGTIKRQKVGNVSFTYPRLYEKLPLLGEELHNLRRIGDNGARDAAGATYISRQTDYIAQRGANFRAALTMGMLRDSLYLTVDGDAHYYSFSGNAADRINFQQPAGNRSQLDMLGGGDIISTSWDNSTSDIPGNLGDIDAAFQELYGGSLRNIICTNKVWKNVLANDNVQSQAGIANQPFSSFARIVGKRPDNSDLTVQAAVLACRPQINWYVTDEGLEMGAPGSETFSKYIGENDALFLPDPDAGMFNMQLGSEPVVEFDGGPESVRFGQYLWSNKSYDPASTNIFNLDNALAINDVPNSVAYGTVIF